MISSNPFNDDFTFELENDMLSKPVKCLLLQSYSTIEVISKISSVKKEFFEKIKKKIFETVF